VAPIAATADTPPTGALTTGGIAGIAASAFATLLGAIAGIYFENKKQKEIKKEKEEAKQHQIQVQSMLERERETQKKEHAAFTEKMFMLVSKGTGDSPRAESASNTGISSGDLSIRVASADPSGVALTPASPSGIYADPGDDRRV